MQNLTVICMILMTTFDKIMRSIKMTKNADFTFDVSLDISLNKNRSWIPEIVNLSLNADKREGILIELKCNASKRIIQQ